MSRKRNLDLSQELSEDRENWDAETEPIPTVTIAADTPVVLPPSQETTPRAAVVADVPVMPALASLTPEMAAMVQMMAAAMQQGMVGAINQTKPPVKEVESEQRSVFNPAGNTEPRPVLLCDTYIGVMDEQNPANPPTPAVHFDAAQCTNREIVALNALPEGRHTIEMYDGVNEPVQIYTHRDMSSGQPTRRTIAFRKQALGKDRRNLVPGPVRIAQQLVTA